VIIPAQNTVNLMLRAEVLRAVEEGKFHIYAVRTIDEGLELLTGVPAGELQEDGNYPEDSVHGRVMARLDEIAENLSAKEEQQEQRTVKESANQENGEPEESDTGSDEKSDQ
jgi:predicted ATP-dependent protease